MRNSDLTTFMLKTTQFYSPFMLKKFEWTMFRIANNNGEKWTVDIFSPHKESRRFGPARSTIVLYFSIVVLSTVLFLSFAISRSIRGLCKEYWAYRFSVENPISLFLGAFPDPSPRKFSVYERTRPLTKLNSNGESALILRQQPCVVNTAQFSIFLLRRISNRI